MPIRAKSRSPRPAAILRDAFAAPPPANESLEEGFHGAVLEKIILPRLTRGERWQAALLRAGLPFGGKELREKLAARQTVADLRKTFGAEGSSLSHPAQLAPFLEALIDMPEELRDERAALESGLAGLLIEYRYKYSIQCSLMCYYSKIAKRAYGEGLKQQRMISKINSDDERQQVLAAIRDKYLNFIRNYFFACMTRENVLKGEPLFSDFIAASLFLARIANGATLEKEPEAVLLPHRDHLLFAALRDPVVARAASDDAYQRKMSAAIREFPS